MKKPSSGRMCFILGALLILGIGLLVYTVSRAPSLAPTGAQRPGFGGSSLVTSAGQLSGISSIWLRIRTRFDLPRPWLIQVTGTTGTPVVVGYKVDRWRSGSVRGVIPTKFTVLARHRVEVAIKNVGNTNAQIGYMAGNGGSGPGKCYPFYGISGGQYEKRTGPSSSEASSGGGPNLIPTDWPVTLPPGMTMREAKKHDFVRERTKAELKDVSEDLAKSPRDHRLLEAVGRLNFMLKNNAAAEEAYAQLFNSDCKDPTFLNIAVWEYVDTYSGTNLQLALEVALKIQAPAPEDPYIADTVGWILFKRGDYQEALPLLKLGQQVREAASTASFHLGMDYYMLMEENAARMAFQGVNLVNGEPRESEETKKCLAMLGLNVQLPMPNVIAKLKARLHELPDDPVALDRLGELFEQQGTPLDQLPRDPLILKAVGVRAYRRGDYLHAVQYFIESAKDPTTDPELFFYLGMARNQLNQKGECTDSLNKALALHLKVGHAREATNVLTSLSLN